VASYRQNRNSSGVTGDRTDINLRARLISLFPQDQPVSLVVKDHDASEADVLKPPPSASGIQRIGLEHVESGVDTPEEVVSAGGLL
jgi:hypothetical protein